MDTTPVIKVDPEELNRIWTEATVHHIENTIYAIDHVSSIDRAKLDHLNGIYDRLGFYLKDLAFLIEDKKDAA